MKKSLKIILICSVALILIIGIYFSIPSKTLDFRGNVTKIETTDGITVFYISYTVDTHEVSYKITADEKTKVSYCHKDDGEITLEDIKVGDLIEGDYRAFSKEKTAKYITVQFSEKEN